MAPTDTSRLLMDSMAAILDSWSGNLGGEDTELCRFLEAQLADITGHGAHSVLATIDNPELKEKVTSRLGAAAEYWADVRYSTLEPVTMLWGTVINATRVAAESDRVTERQRQVFDFKGEDVVPFFRAARLRMEVADALYHLFRAMPAPECQAMSALLNVHVDARLDEAVMCRLVRLLDHEGPMTPEEMQDLATLTNTNLVDATFRGLRGQA